MSSVLTTCLSVCSVPLPVCLSLCAGAGGLPAGEVGGGAGQAAAGRGEGQSAQELLGEGQGRGNTVVVVIVGAV